VCNLKKNELYESLDRLLKTLAANYRPIVVSSIFSKLFELIVCPRDISISNNRFGFRSDFGVYNGTSLLNDLLCNSKYTGSSMFICSLDAKKCFDSIWHDGLLHQLYNRLPDVHWLFLRKLNFNLDDVIKWNDYIHYSTNLGITRVTNQGSLLSPVLFNLFIASLILGLFYCKHGYVSETTYTIRLLMLMMFPYLVLPFQVYKN